MAICFGPDCLLVCMILYACLVVLQAFSFAKQLSKKISLTWLRPVLVAGLIGFQAISEWFHFCDWQGLLFPWIQRHSLLYPHFFCFKSETCSAMLCLSWWRQGGPGNPFVSFSQSLWHFERGSQRLATLRIWQPQSLIITLYHSQVFCFHPSVAITLIHIRPLCLTIAWSWVIVQAQTNWKKNPRIAEDTLYKNNVVIAYRKNSILKNRTLIIAIYIIPS